VSNATKQLNEVIVEITRDPMMKPSTTVYAHEVEILKHIHGEDAVRVVESYQVYAPEGFTVEDEFERLRLKYNRRLKPGQPDLLREAFPRGVFDLADALSMRLSGSVKTKYQTESIQKTRNDRRVVNADTDTTKPERVDVRHTDGGDVVDKTVPVRVKSDVPADADAPAKVKKTVKAKATAKPKTAAKPAKAKTAKAS